MKFSESWLRSHVPTTASRDELSAVLTAIALGSTFNTPSWRVLIYTIVGVIFTVFVQGAMNTVLTPAGIPTLTMPFVLASWLFLVPNKDVMPAHRQ